MIAGVWIVEAGEYEDRHIAGIYLTAEAGMAAFPHKDGWEIAQARGWAMEMLHPEGGPYDVDAMYDDPHHWASDEADCRWYTIDEATPPARH